MNAARLFAPLLLTLPVVCPPSAQASDGPDALRSYRFVPALSTLRESGGFAGFVTDFTIRGSFDFVTYYGYGSGPEPSIVRKALFDDVEAWASHPILAYVLNVDRELGLSTLSGTLAPLGLPIDVYRFTGSNDDGHPVELYTASVGRWLYLRGETSPPCCDFFKYEVRAVARLATLADRNRDGQVDRGDLTQWGSDFGLPAAAALDDSNALGAGVVDGGDFLAWQREASAAPPDFATLDAAISAALASSSDAATIASVAVAPEPATLILGIVAAGLAWGRRSRRRPVTPA
ncbi:MAG: hypothetical protein KF688_16655 [Pirellulales bacterium]|nr:hypothetical protein [Pirellulales bacterium]